MPKTIKITNTNGTSMGTKVFDAETGAEIRGVESISVLYEVDKPVTADVRVAFVQHETLATPRFMMADPRTGSMREISKIIFADGQVFDPKAE
jgi:hypothetical protein